MAFNTINWSHFSIFPHSDPSIVCIISNDGVIRKRYLGNTQRIFHQSTHSICIHDAPLFIFQKSSYQVFFNEPNKKIDGTRSIDISSYVMDIAILPTSIFPV